MFFFLLPDTSVCGQVVVFGGCVRWLMVDRPLFLPLGPDHKEAMAILVSDWTMSKVAKL